MRRPRRIWQPAAVAILITTPLIAAPGSPASRPPVPAQTKQEAEQNVLRIAARSWSHRRIGDLIDPRTGLLRDNVQTFCKGRGQRFRGAHYTRFLCTLRPWPSSGKQELYVTYRVLPHGRLRVHWLRFHRR
jgi:hypothetical protein